MSRKKVKNDKLIISIKSQLVSLLFLIIVLPTYLLRFFITAFYTLGKIDLWLEHRYLNLCRVEELGFDKKRFTFYD
jgi:hypothetical protein